MNTQIQDPVAGIRNGQLIDLTTTGRHSGGAKRLEIVIFSFDGRLCISGLPGPRAWLANVAADPAMDDARVGAALRAIRIRRGWRQADVATRAGVSRRWCRSWNAGTWMG
ncbi:MAG: helix-turn-helix domain-containing protein [Chloroflexota bacterium]|nr:helix-turn-helix domain-containing protein [Chloroflexota bacterium]